MQDACICNGSGFPLVVLYRFIQLSNWNPNVSVNNEFTFIYMSFHIASIFEQGVRLGHKCIKSLSVQYKLYLISSNRAYYYNKTAVSNNSQGTLLHV